MTIKVTYNVTDVYMSQSVSPVYINVSYSDGGASGGGVWGSITGTLSNQTDLQNALNAKFDDPTGTTTQYIDGTGALQTFPLTLPVLQEVRNQTGATLVAGTVVYINGATGNKPTVTKAIATGDATSAQTLGMISAAIANNGVGYVVVIGTCGGLDTSAYTEGQQLYLSGTVAGGVTTTKPYAPIHLVYVGIVTRAHPNLGTVEVRVQNGFEMDEIHNVSAQTPSNNDGLFYNTSTLLWESKSITTALGYTPVPTTRNITINGVTYDLSADRTYTISTGISGSGASGQVTYWTGASAVSGSNNLFWDNANGRLGIGTNTPAYTFDIPANNTNNIQYRVGTFQIQSYGLNNGFLSDNMYFNGTSWTRTTTGFGYGFQFYNGQLMLHGASTSSGIFTQNVKFKFDYEGAFVIGNNLNVTQGNYTGATALFTKTGNLILNSPTLDGGQRLQVYGDTLLRGSGSTNTTTGLTVQNSSSTNLLRVLNNGDVSFGADAMFWDNANGRLGIGTNVPAYTVDIVSNQNASTSVGATNTTSGTLSLAEIFCRSSNGYISFAKNSALRNAYKIFLANDGTIYNGTAGDIAILNDFATGRIKFAAGAVSTSQMTLFANGNLAINSGVSDLGVRFGVVGDTLLRGSGATNATTALTVQNSSSTNLLTVRNDGVIGLTGPSFNINSTSDFIFNYNLVSDGIVFQPTNANQLSTFALKPSGTNTNSYILLGSSNGVLTGTASFLFGSGFGGQPSGTWAIASLIYGDVTGIARPFAFVVGSSAGRTEIMRLTGTGVAIRQTSNTALLDIAASTTSSASLRLRSGTAPTTLNDGDIWFDGTDIKMRIGGVTKTFTLV